MPNLTVMVSENLRWDQTQLKDIAANMEAVLTSCLGIPAHAPNVMLLRSFNGGHAADVYAEFVFRAAPSRDDAKMSELASQLSRALPSGFSGTFALRAFGHTQHTIISKDLRCEA